YLFIPLSSIYLSSSLYLFLSGLQYFTYFSLRLSQCQTFNLRVHYISPSLFLCPVSALSFSSSLSPSLSLFVFICEHWESFQLWPQHLLWFVPSHTHPHTPTPTTTTHTHN